MLPCFLFRRRSTMMSSSYNAARSTARTRSQAHLPHFSRPHSVAARKKPVWLQSILDDSTPPPRPYAWTLENLECTSLEAHKAQRALKEADRDRRIFVLGLGNLGRLYATSLSQLPDPPPITLVVHRKSLLQHWAAEPGIEITRHGSCERFSNFDIEWWTDEKPLVGPVREVVDGGRISNLIIATKAPDAMPQIDRLRHYLDASSNIAFVQNGINRLWPPHGAVYNAHRFPHGSRPNFLHAVTTHGVFSTGVFKSIHAAPADVVIGPVCLSESYGGRADCLTILITTAPHLAGRAVGRSELWIVQLEKLVINMIINPLTAILRVNNGELFVDSQGPIGRVMEEILRETSDVLLALVRHESSREILKNGQKSLEALTNRLSRSSLRDMLYIVGEKVKHNKSSMLQDVEAGRQTEIREFNGWLVETAEFLDQDLKVRSHEILIDLVEEGVKLDEAELSMRLLIHSG